MVSLGILTFLAALIGFVGSFSRNMCLIVYFVLGAISFLMQVAILVGLFFFYDQVIPPGTLPQRPCNSLLTPLLIGFGAVHELCTPRSSSMLCAPSRPWWPANHSSGAPDGPRAPGTKQTLADALGAPPGPLTIVFPSSLQTLNAYTKGNPERLAYIEPYLDVGRWVFLGLVALQGVSLSMAVFMRCCCHLEEDFMDLESAQDKELHLQQLKEDISSMGEGSAAQDKCVPAPQHVPLPCLPLPLPRDIICLASFPEDLTAQGQV